MIEKTIVAIPIYSEIKNLSGITHGVSTQAPNVDVLIVGGNSPDGTGRLTGELGAKDSRIHVLHHQKKSGLGPAYLAAFVRASEHGYIWMDEFDVDELHRLQGLPCLLVMARGTAWPDLVIGSRQTRGGGTREWSRKCKLLGHAGNLYVNIILGLRVHDATIGFRIYRVDSLDRLLRAVNIESRDYDFQVEMAQRTWRAAGQIKEVPTIFVEWRAGTSRVLGSIIQEASVKALRWHVSELLRRSS